MIGAFLNAPVSSSAREVEHAAQEHIRYLAVDDPLVAVNIDTPEDLNQLQAGSTS
jgi:2-phospho-L-lactate guanylyltransferase (CobY/MobA/RfbA family)